MSEREKIEAAANAIYRMDVVDTKREAIEIATEVVAALSAPPDKPLPAWTEALRIARSKSLIAKLPAEREDEVERVTRVVLVDHTSECLGRLYDKWGVRAEIQRQDDGRTLKVFVTDRHESARRGGKGE